MRPFGRFGSDGIEPFEIRERGTSHIVIAADDVRSMIAAPFDNSIGIGSITDNVAAVKDDVVATRRVLQNAVERFPIPVDVAEDEISQRNQAFARRINATSDGAPNRAGTPTVPIPRVTKIEEGPSVYRPYVYGV